MFGKRSRSTTRDRFYNLESLYLLQRMEDATPSSSPNLRINMDDAFIRRLHFAVDFPFGNCRRVPKSSGAPCTRRPPGARPATAGAGAPLPANRRQHRNVVLAAAFLPRRGLPSSRRHLNLPCVGAPRMGKWLARRQYEYHQLEDRPQPPRRRPSRLPAPRRYHGTPYSSRRQRYHQPHAPRTRQALEDATPVVAVWGGSAPPRRSRPLTPASSGRWRPHFGQASRRACTRRRPGSSIAKDLRPRLHGPRRLLRTRPIRSRVRRATSGTAGPRQATALSASARPLRPRQRQHPDAFAGRLMPKGPQITSRTPAAASGPADSVLPRRVTAVVGRRQYAATP